MLRGPFPVWNKEAYEMQNLPILGITMGDPFGNGPEITVKALSDKSVYDRCCPLVVGALSCNE